jgi:hypothetical protein
MNNKTLGAYDRSAAPKAIFNAAVDHVLGDCLATSNQRGDEYQDTWALENQVTTFLDATLRDFGTKLSPEQTRLVMLAALIDVKDSRMIGPFKMDTLVDGINYRACYAHLRELYEIANRIEVTPLESTS